MSSIIFSVRLDLNLLKIYHDQILSPILCDPGKNVFEFRNVKSAELVSVLKKMKVSKSSGFDKIYSKLFKTA